MVRSDDFLRNFMVCTFPYFFDLDDRVRVIGFSYVGCAGFFTHLAKNSWGVEKG